VTEEQPEVRDFWSMTEQEQRDEMDELQQAAWIAADNAYDDHVEAAVKKLNMTENEARELMDHLATGMWYGRAAR
jgi:hypothetical protein